MELYNRTVYLPLTGDTDCGIFIHFYTEITGKTTQSKVMCYGRLRSFKVIRTSTN